MDDDAFRAARDDINRLPCVFEKALLSRMRGVRTALPAMRWPSAN